MPPTDDTARLIREGVVGADRMCRYYGYLTDRLSRLGELLTIGTISFLVGAMLAILNRLPEWVSLAAVAAEAAAAVATAVGRYPQKAARSREGYQALGPLATGWEELWTGAYELDDADRCAGGAAVAAAAGSVGARAGRAAGVGQVDAPQRARG